MQDKFKAKEQLVNELTILRQRVAELGKSYLKIKQAEEKYKSIFENCTEGIYQITPEGRFMDANPAAAPLRVWFTGRIDQFRYGCFVPRCM